MNTNNQNKPMAANSNRLMVDELAARLYHHTLPEWTGEFAFYRELAQSASALGPVLEVACGTGRIAIDLASHGFAVTGFDLSREMLAIARANSVGMDNVRWELADMRSFDLEVQYGLALIPGHSFQFMLTSSDQLACLACIKRHLLPGANLVVHLDHQDLGWLWGVYQENGGKFEHALQIPHPESGNPVYVSKAWRYEPNSQTAFASTVWEERDVDGRLVQRWEREPVALHCVFRFEMEHLLSRAGFVVRAVYGNFERAQLQDDSTDMIWISEVQREEI